MSETPEPKKKSWIGFLGLVLLASGLCIGAIDANVFAVILVVSGGGTLAYALFTGNLKFFG
ncbi:hypothetical protein KC887_08730 [Candidatus Kaiserbacteria bacterium]|nr:hypothetical protein [Candidatus Kaiserbacteria bacterium]